VLCVFAFSDKGSRPTFIMLVTWRYTEPGQYHNIIQTTNEIFFYNQCSMDSRQQDQPTADVGN
jgi:hypothetical protein